MVNKTRTKRVIFGELLELQEIKANQEYTNFIMHELELLEKKATNKVTTTTQKENEGLKEIIVNTLAELGRPVTISELQAENVELSREKYSNQKISALLTQLKNECRVINTKDKKKSYFTVA